ncbi:MAG: 50S ribosomal protein L3 [Clostridiales bacterium]|nr:50S ribosomal protein L3 [Clostridiales bacterium]
MKKAILGIKVGMTQIFAKDGTLIPVTVVEAGPCTVIRKKTVERDGYSALCVGFGEIREKRVNSPLMGEFEKAGVTCRRYQRELPLESADSYEVGQDIKADMFAQGDWVDVTGKTRGHGFAGVIKRWNQHRGPKTHGSKFHRAPGSMGATSSPGRVFKSKRMPGHYGFETVTIQNLKVVRVDAERNMLLISGAVPGTRGSLLMIRDAVKKQ